MSAAAEHELVLFVNGASDRSGHAVDLARGLCALHLGATGRLLVIDIAEHPRAALRSGVQAAPTLVRAAPLPVRRFTGDLSRTDEVVAALGLPGAGGG